MNLLNIKNLVVGYHSEPLNYPVSFNVTKNGLYAIRGQNGCGKSTFLKTIIGLNKPLKGQIIFKKEKTNLEIPKFSYVPQFHSVNKFFHLPVLEFVKQGFGPNFKIEQKHHDLIKSLLHEWELNLYSNKSFHELSGGQKTRALLVRAFATQAKILFLDEPLSSLDVCCQAHLMQTLSTYVKKHNYCVFIIDHHIDKFKHMITHYLDFDKAHDDPKSHIILR